MYKAQMPEFTRFLHKNLKLRKLPDIVAEFCACSGVPLVEAYKMAKVILENDEECDVEIKRLEGLR
jgi:hypothetical protein